MYRCAVRLQGPWRGACPGLHPERTVGARTPREAVARRLACADSTAVGGVRTPRPARRVAAARGAARVDSGGGRLESAPVVPAPGPEAVADGRPGMAFMEKPPAGKVLLDDTVPLTAAIEASQSLQSHTVRGPPGRAGGAGWPAAERGCGRPAGKPGRAHGQGSAAQAGRASGWRWVWVWAPGAQAIAEVRKGRRWGSQPPGPKNGRGSAAPRRDSELGWCWVPGPTLGRPGNRPLRTLSSTYVHRQPSPPWGHGVSLLPAGILSGGDQGVQGQVETGLQSLLDGPAERKCLGSAAPVPGQALGRGRETVKQAVWGPAEAGV